MSKEYDEMKGCAMMILAFFVGIAIVLAAIGYFQ